MGSARRIRVVLLYGPIPAQLCEGGTFFFTVALANRRSRMLTEHIDALRNTFRIARRERPFDVDAIVILPDHLHAVFTLPEGDANFSRRWQRIKAVFTSQVRAAGVAIASDCKGEYPTLAKTILGTHDPRSRGFRTACGLHSFQSGEARTRIASQRLAVFVVPPLCPPGNTPGGLGRRCRRV